MRISSIILKYSLNPLFIENNSTLTKTEICLFSLFIQNIYQTLSRNVASSFTKETKINSITIFSGSKHINSTNSKNATSY